MSQVHFHAKRHTWTYNQTIIHRINEFAYYLYPIFVPRPCPSFATKWWSYPSVMMKVISFQSSKHYTGTFRLEIQNSNYNLLLTPFSREKQKGRSVHTIRTIMILTVTWTQSNYRIIGKWEQRHRNNFSLMPDKKNLQVNGIISRVRSYSAAHAECCMMQPFLKMWSSMTDCALERSTCVSSISFELPWLLWYDYY